MSNSKYKCPLCGLEFDDAGALCHSCPMSKNCKVICCPNCGYGFTDESRLVEWLKRRLSFGESKSGGNKPSKEDAK